LIEWNGGKPYFFNITSFDWKNWLKGKEKIGLSRIFVYSNKLDFSLLFSVRIFHILSTPTVREKQKQKKGIMRKKHKEGSELSKKKGLIIRYPIWIKGVKLVPAKKRCQFDTKISLSVSIKSIFDTQISLSASIKSIFINAVQVINVDQLKEYVDTKIWHVKYQLFVTW